VPADGSAAIPWTIPLSVLEVRDLRCYLHTACLIITAMITGMRSCELKELRIGCRRSTVTGPGLTRYRLAGKLIKGQGLGGTDDEWVVVEEVDRAVALAEQLCDDTAPGAPVFGAFAFGSRYPRFRAWVNGPAGQRLCLAPIPSGPPFRNGDARSASRTATISGPPPGTSPSSGMLLAEHGTTGYENTRGSCDEG
jgi:hypothetical protein